MCIFLRNEHIEAKALFGCCFLGHSLWECHIFFLISGMS